MHRYEHTPEIENLIKDTYAVISPDQYLSANQDVADNGIHPIHHFIKYGWRENRHINQDIRSDTLLSNNVGLRTAIIKAQNENDLEVIEKLFSNKIHNKLINKVRFVGYVEARLGIGVAARHTISCYNRLSTDFSIYPYNNNAIERFESLFMASHYNTHQNFNINVFEIGLDNAALAIDKVTRQRSRQSYNVLKLYWELSTLPTEKIDEINRYDEIWVPSKFVYDCVSKVYNKPIFLIPPFIDVNFEYENVKKRFRMDKSVYYYLFMFDYNSSVERKNPYAVVKAFQDAFPKENTGVGLIIKSNKPPTNVESISSMILTNGGDNRIHVIEDQMKRNEVLSLIADCNCYVSLHRSEGYGMGMAEAIRLGRPVIATNYSGNVDFMNFMNSYPVEYKLIKIFEDQYYLGCGREWAEPSHDSAVKQFLKAYKARKSLVRYFASKLFIYRKNIPTCEHIGKMIFDRITAIQRMSDDCIDR